MSQVSQQPPIEIGIERVATGGEGVGRMPDGRVVFVGGALPGERVRAQLVDEKKRFARGVTLEVLEPSPWRVSARCEHARSGRCGGCDWMHVAAERQPILKRDIVIEQLQRLGGLEQPAVSIAEAPVGTRTTVRCAVTDGRAGYRSRRSNTGFAAEQCPAAHPLLEELIVEGRFSTASEVLIRAGVATGERLVVTDGDPGAVLVPDDVQVAHAGDAASTFVHEMVAGRRWRISADSFFQASQEGAEALVTEIRYGLADVSGDVADLYAGVGLLGGAAASGLAVSVESNPSSSADARHNLDATVEVVQSRVEGWSARPVAAVVADPARRGLRAGGVAAIEATYATRLLLVSCDPASLGRDTALLGEQGWRYDRGTVIEMFPDTSRIEVVSVFSR